MVADDQVAREEHDDVARVLDERPEALGALPLVEVGGEICALDRESDLRGECLDALARLLREGLGRGGPEREVVTGSGERDLGPDVGAGVARAGLREHRPAADERDVRSALSDEVPCRLDGDAIDVVSRPRSDEIGGCRSEHTLTPLRPLVTGHEPGEPNEHQSRERDSRADHDEQLARARADSGDREHRRRRQRCDRQDREALPAQPLLRVRVRLGEHDHRRVESGRPPEDSGDDEEEIDRVADAVPAVERAEAIQGIARELEDERDRDQREGGRAEPRAEHHPRGERDEQDVHHREREGDGRRERARIAVQARVHEKRPADERDGHRDDACIDEARPVAARSLLADHHEQRRRQDDVRAEREVVRGRRKRHRADLLELDRVERIGGDGAQAAERDEVPRRSRARAVQPDPDERRDDRRDREQLIPAVVVRRVARQ